MNVKQEIAEIDRQRVRSARAASGPLAGLPPEFPGVIVSDTDRRVYVDKLLPGQKLPVTLKLWENQHPDDRVTVQIAQTEISTSWVTVDEFDAGTDIGARPPEYIAGIPTENLTDYNAAGTPSEWWVRYRVRHPLGNTWTSDPKEIVIDRRAHYQADPDGPKSRPPMARANPAIPSSYIIDDTYVGNLPSGVMEVTVGTQGWEAGDICYLYISKLFSEANGDEPVNPPPYTLPQTGVFQVPGATLRSLPPGTNFLFYQHVDAVGNKSNLSDAQPLKIVFAPAPVLEDPIVPLAQTDRLIDLKDCAEPGGVTVEVERVEHIEDTDEIKLEWNNTPVDTKAFGSLTKLVFPVPFATIFNDYYSGGLTTEGNVPVNVQATLLRGTETLSDSSVDISSNLYVAGPTDPTDPGQPNDDLDAPNVTSTAVDNIIEIADYGDNQTITIDLWADTNKPVKQGQMIRAEYAGVELDDVAFLDDNDTEATIILPWNVINDAGIGPHNLQYFVSDIGGVNENPSLIQTVTNNAMVVDLDPPSITTDNPGVLLCDDLDQTTWSAVVNIEGNPVHLQVGREVTLRAQGYRDAGYTQVAPGTAFTSTTPHTIVDPEPTAGFTMTIQPYDPYIRDIPEPPPTSGGTGPYLGYWRIWYEVKINGVDYPSDKFEIVVNLVNSYNEYCEQT